MRSWRLVVLLLLFSAGAAALWFGSTGRGDGSRTAQPAESSRAAYDYEANDVVLRQMGPDGRLTFQIEARQITQLPDSGRVIAGTLTLYHDPPGTPVGSPHRWTLTADRGELPAEGGVVTLSGKVHARSIPVGALAELKIATDHLRYDMATQELGSDETVRLDWGNRHMRCGAMRANITTGSSALDSCDLEWGGKRMQCRRVEVNFRTGNLALESCDATLGP